MVDVLSNNPGATIREVVNFGVFKKYQEVQEYQAFLKQKKREEARNGRR